MAKSIVEKYSYLIKSQMLQLPKSCRFDFLTVESYRVPDFLYAIIEVLINVELIPFKNAREKTYFSGLLTYLKQFRRKTRKEVRICDVLKQLKKYDNYIFEVLDFGTPRVAVFWYQNIRNPRKRTGNFYSVYNDDYICSRNVILLVNEKVPPKERPKPWYENVVDLLEQHFSCSICCETLLEGVETTCKHRFCKSCLAKWNTLNALCPLCRQATTRPATEYHANEFIEDIYKLFPKRNQDERRKRRKLSNIG